MSDTLTEPAPAADEPESGGSRRRVAPFIALAVAIVIGALFVVLAGSDTTRNDEIDSALVDKPAPLAQSTTLDGGTFDLSRRKGSWVVLNFFEQER